MNKAKTIKASSIDFNHRVSYRNNGPLEAFELRDAIERAIDQADGVISLMQSWHVADSQDQVDAINPETLFFCLETVSQNLADIRAIAKAFMEVSP